MNVTNLWIRRVFFLILAYFFSMEVVHLMSKRHYKAETIVMTERKLLNTSSAPRNNIKTNSTHNKQLIKSISLDSGKLVLYNRISKCGSMTMIALLKRLATKNKFQVSRKIDLKRIVKNYNPNMKDTIFIEHRIFQPLPKSLRKNITYINIMRNPIKRFVSFYYYNRFHMFKKYVPIPKKGDIMIVSEEMLTRVKKEWVDKNIHSCGNKGLQDVATHQKCTENMKYMELDKGVVKHLRNLASLWLKKSLSNCINNGNDRECHDFSKSRPKQVNFRTMLVLHHAGPINIWNPDISSLYPPYFTDPSSARFLCGIDQYCFNSINDEASAQSIRNIESSYAVVGILEDMDMTLKVLEYKLPRFFKGALEEYNEMKKEEGENVNSMQYDIPVPNVLDKLEKYFAPENKIYNYAAKRLQMQFRNIAT